jgi:ABC-2 type transport system permease protein
LIPLAFFPGTIQNILLKLPFAAIQSTPTLILLGRLSGKALLEALTYQVLWAIVLTLISSYIWHRTLNNLKVNGG